MKDLLKNIETAINNGELTKAKRLLKAFSAIHKATDEARVQAASYYRWLGDLKSSLKTLGGALNLAGQNPTDYEALRRAELARALCYLGADRISEQVLNRIPAAKNKVIEEKAAFIHFSLGHYDRALEYFSRFETLPDSELNYTYRVRIAYAAFCRILLKDYQTPKLHLNHLLEISPEPKLIALCRNFLAVYELGIGQFNEALVEIELCFGYLKSDDTTPEYTDALKSKGLILSALKRFDEADALLAEAYSRAFKRIGFLDECLEILFAQGLARYHREAKFPAEWLRLMVYPFQSHNRYPDQIEEFTPTPTHFFYSYHGLTAVKSKIHYDLSSEVKSWVDPLTLKPKHQLGFNITDHVLQFLTRAGPVGISQYRLYDILWTDDFSIDQAERRIAQILGRIRAQGYPVKWHSGHIMFEDDQGISIDWSQNVQVRGLPFLASRKQFTRNELQEFFDISKSTALQVCSDWLTEKVIEVADTGSNTLYRVLS